MPRTFLRADESPERREDARDFLPRSYSLIFGGMGAVRNNGIGMEMKCWTDNRVLNLALILNHRLNNLIQPISRLKCDRGADAVELGDSSRQIVEGLAVGLFVGDSLDLAR
jgi:hypothetical protein